MSSIWTIRRSATDVKLTGLCGGVAQHWGVDPVLVRIGWALLALSGGIGIVLYVAGWLLIPVEGTDRARADDLFGGQTQNWSKEAWVVIVAVSCVVVFTLLGFATPFGFGPAVILALIWYFGYYKNRTRPEPPRTTEPMPNQAGITAVAVSHRPAADAAAPQFFRYPGPETDFTRAAHAWRQRIEANARRVADPGPEPRMEPAGLAASWSPAPPGQSVHAQYDQASSELAQFWAQPDPVGLYVEPLPMPPTVARRSDSRSARRLRLVGLIALGLTMSGLAIAQGLGIAVSVAAYCGAALLVVGLTLVAATWFGRARGILAVGLLLAVAVISTSVAGPIAKTHDWGTSSVAYTRLADLPAAPDTQDFGKLTVDLSQLSVTRDAAYAAHVDLGSLEVIVPKDVNVRVRYSVDSGVLHPYEQEPRSGEAVNGVIEPTTGRSGRPTLTLDVSVDHGELRVRQ